MAPEKIMGSLETETWAVEVIHESYINDVDCSMNHSLETWAFRLHWAPNRWQFLQWTLQRLHR